MLKELLQRTKYDIDHCLSALENAPEKDAILDLIEACEELDCIYQNEFCFSNDEEYGLSEGSTYDSEIGQSMEFYIEAGSWHKISLSLRKLKE